MPQRLRLTWSGFVVRGDDQIPGLQQKTDFYSGTALSSYVSKDSRYLLHSY